MADEDKVETRYHYEFIHNVLGHFYKDTLDYFADYLYPRFTEWKIIGTYDKAVQYLLQNEKAGRETDQPQKPALILNPSGDFDFDETYGKLSWRFPNLAPGMVKRIYDPIYQDQNIIITPGFSRLKGEMEFIALVNSFYEYCDVKLFLGLIFGGKDRYITPSRFSSFIILPPEIYDYTYNNEYTGVSYKINIEEAENRLIKTTNRTEVVFPCEILPKYKLTGMSDASSRLGGTDKLPEWKINFNVEYEVEVPSWLILETDYLAQKLKVNMRYGSCYSSNPTYNSDEVPVNISTFTTEMIYVDSTTGDEINIDSTTPIIINQLPDHADITNKKELLFKTRYFHIVTEEEADSTTTAEFTLPEVILNKNTLIVNGKYGHLAYGDHYTISEDGENIIINKTYVNLDVDDVLELYVYEFI